MSPQFKHGLLRFDDKIADFSSSKGCFPFGRFFGAGTACAGTGGRKSVKKIPFIVFEIYTIDR